MIAISEIQEAAIQPLEKARSLPFSAYTDPSFFAAEAEQIFSKEWVFVCMEGELPQAGDYFAMTLANEPIIILRANNGGLRALSNICRHRGTTLLDEGFGKVDKYITCPYHAWTYDVDGALKAIPYNKLIAVDRREHHLPTFPVSTWNGLVFVNLDVNAKPLADRVGGIDEYLRLFQPETFTHVSPGDAEIWQTNWKLAMENAMESYHLFKVHEETLEPYSPTRGAYYIAGSSEWSLTGGVTQRKKGMVEKLMGSTHNELYEHYLLVSLPPSFVGILSYGSFGWLSAHPIDASHTQIRSGATATSGGLAGSMQSKEFTKAFFQEDQDMCERVQKGMRSKFGSGGKLVDMERVVVDFHQFLGTRLGGLPATQLFEDDAANQWRNVS
ncbi:MAG: aromatic ring-hydroxylating oxygenase subunit alpha [Pseudomonadales bacterium]